MRDNRTESAIQHVKTPEMIPIKGLKDQEPKSVSLSDMVFVSFAIWRSGCMRFAA